jgi:hypothetical protein
MEFYEYQLPKQIRIDAVFRCDYGVAELGARANFHSVARRKFASIEINGLKRQLHRL